VNLPGQVVCPVRSSEIRRQGLGPAAAVANLGDDAFGFGLATAIVNQNLCACLGKCQALARPMLREAPVTSAVLPERFTMIESFPSNAGRS
jgi:hypothetical protein